jgi:hypothetical protein
MSQVDSKNVTSALDCHDKSQTKALADSTIKLLLDLGGKEKTNN